MEENKLCCSTMWEMLAVSRTAIEIIETTSVKDAARTLRLNFQFNSLSVLKVINEQLQKEQLMNRQGERLHSN